MSSALHVVFRLADAEYAIAASDVVQLESYQGATPVPGASAWIAGLMQVRGRVVPVVDLRARFGHPPQPLTLDSRVLVVRRHDRTVGLLVDAAREVRTLDTAAIAPAPDTLRQATGGLVAAIVSDTERTTPQRMIMMLDLDLIMGAQTPWLAP